MTSLNKILLSTGLDEEPYVEIASCNELTGITRDDYVRINQQRRQSLRYEFYKIAYDFLSDSNIKGDYFEFGCHKARSFRMAMSCSNFYQFKNTTFYAFDSFTGLPATDALVIDKWQPGALTTSRQEFIRLLTESGFNVDNVEIVEGYYDQTLNDDLKKQLLKNKVKANLVTIDCDLYDSAKDVFSFIDDFIAFGSIIHLDGVFSGFTPVAKGGMGKAFHDYEKASQFKFIEFYRIGWWGKAFVAVPRDNDAYSSF